MEHVHQLIANLHKCQKTVTDIHGIFLSLIFGIMTDLLFGDRLNPAVDSKVRNWAHSIPSYAQGATVLSQSFKFPVGWYQI
jgi:hypothetical protein